MYLLNAGCKFLLRGRKLMHLMARQDPVKRPSGYRTQRRSTADPTCAEPKKELFWSIFFRGLIPHNQTQVVPGRRRKHTYYAPIIVFLIHPLLHILLSRGNSRILVGISAYPRRFPHLFPEINGSGPSSTF